MLDILGRTIIQDQCVARSIHNHKFHTRRSTIEIWVRASIAKFVQNSYSTLESFSSRVKNVCHVTLEMEKDHFIFQNIIFRDRDAKVKRTTSRQAYEL
jgi:hypothetical protein